MSRVWARAMTTAYASSNVFLATTSNAYAGNIRVANYSDILGQYANRQKEPIAKPMPMQGVRHIDLGAVAQIKNAPVAGIKIEL